MDNENSFLDVDTTDAVEPTVVDAGECEIRIIGGDINTDKNSHPYFLPRFEAVGEPHAKDFTDFIGLPYEGMDEKELARAKWKIECFKRCFGIAGSRVEPDEIVGLTGWVILKVKEDVDYGEQNKISKYILPK
ncbi:unnamed protein product [marine sediment metagenome]|uniref:Uncharacterized protein n=1 Tax=marine sediment metagenome TaxID=412755 RepID=X0TKW3_9ZZZZ